MSTRPVCRRARGWSGAAARACGSVWAAARPVQWRRAQTAPHSILILSSAPIPKCSAAQEVIHACIQMGEQNPILSIHDVGAGGLSNALPELVHGAGKGARIEFS